MSKATTNREKIMSDTHAATVDAAQFYQAVANAALFASTDDTLPTLTTIRLAAGQPGQLRLEATNRYIASQEWLALIDREHDTDHPDHEKCPVLETTLDILVPVKNLLKITKMLKQLEQPSYGTNGQPKVVIEYADGGKHAAFTLTDHMDPDQTLRAEVTEGSYPKTDALFAGHRVPKKSAAYPGTVAPECKGLPGEYKISSKWLAALARVSTGDSREDKHLGVEFSLGLDHLVTPANGNPPYIAPSPAIATVGERFRALVMPLREPA